MRYRVSSVEYGTADMVMHYPCLAKFGLEIEKVITPSRSVIRYEIGNPIQVDDNYTVTYTPYLNIDTLEQLAEFIAAIDEQIIMSVDHIEIYDGYRE